MKDINGKEIKTGDIVEIRGAYFKTDNHLWLVDRCPGDPSWTGKDLSLRKISKTGKLAAKHNVGFWPIFVTVSSREKRAAAHEWNEKNAVIEIVEIPNMAEVKAHFEEEAKSNEERAEYMFWRDWSDDTIQLHKTIAEYFRGVAERI